MLLWIDDLIIQIGKFINMFFPKRMELWHNESPGGRVNVLVRWPRYLWVKGPDEEGRPQSFATNGEILRMYKEKEYLHSLCDCSVHDITTPGAAHADDCPRYD